MGRPSARRSHGSLGSGAVTALALTVQMGLAAVVGVIIAREFGRDAQTDGFFAAYGVFVTLSLAATSVRIVVLAPLARARVERRLGAETAGWALALGAVVVPGAVLGVVLAAPVAALITGFGPDGARVAAADALPWLLLAALGHFGAGLAASALAALDDYRSAAVAYITGSVVGLGYILARVDADGIDAVPPGIALNAAIAVLGPTVVLAIRARSVRMAPSSLRPAGPTLRSRLELAASGIALPLGLQAVYLICLPFASREGIGAVTSFGYAYLAGSAVVAVTAASLGLVTSVPLARTTMDSLAIVRHVLAASWVALLAVGATAGIFSVAGQSILTAVLGNAYEDDVGSQIGWLIAVGAPWMVATIGVSVALPLVFVLQLSHRLPRVAVTTLAVHLPAAVLGQVVAGVYGLAVALAFSTLVSLTAILQILGIARVALLGLAREVAVVGGMTMAAFAPAAFIAPDTIGALIGVAGFVIILSVVRPIGLRSSWRYLRALS